MRANAATRVAHDMTQPARNRRVAFLMSTASWGGIERWMVNLANEFVRSGISVDLVLVRNGVVPFPNELSKDVRIVDFSGRGAVSSLLSLSRYFRGLPGQPVLASKYHDAVAADRANRLAGSRIRLFWVVHSAFRSSRKTRRWFRAVKRRFRRANSLIPVSQGGADHLINTFGLARETVHSIPNPVFGADVRPRCEKAVDHDWLLPENRNSTPVVLGAGRLVKAKDFATLIRAAALLLERRPCRLLILGEGPLRTDLEELTAALGLQEYVQLPGWVDDPMPYMARADLFVLSSQNEGLGNVLIEAMAAGCPVVSTDCPSGPREILEGGRLGPLVPAEDPKKLANAMGDTLDRGADTKALRAAAERFSSAHVAKLYMEVLGLRPENENRDETGNGNQ